MKKILMMGFVLFLFVGCATEARLQQALNSTVGLSERQLVDKMGIPHRVYQLGTVKYLSYEYSSSYYVPQSQSTSINGYGNMIWADTNTYGGYTVNHNCNITFVVERGVVSNWRYDGNACKL